MTPPDPPSVRRLERLLDARTAEAIGAPELERRIAPVSEFGRRARECEGLFGPGDEERATTTIARVVAVAGQHGGERIAAIRAAIRAVPDVGAIVLRVRFGEEPSDVELFEIDRFVTSAGEVRALAGPDLVHDVAMPSLAGLDARFAPGRVNNAVTRGFLIADAYDAALEPVRAKETAAVRAVEAEWERQTRAVEAALGRSVRREEFALLRDEVPAVLPDGVRVVREAPAYVVCTIEPDGAVLEAERAHAEVLGELAEIEERVRRTLTREVARDADLLDDASQALGTLDLLLARVEFTQRYGGCVPRLQSRSEFALEEMTFVPLADALGAAGRRYVPIALRFARVAILRGPNMGGKSAALRACGFAALCVALGVPPPARTASMPLFKRIAWVGGEREEAFLSSFGEDVVRVQEALESRAEPALVLVDEFARTTSPRAGEALVDALVDALARRNVRAVVATHFTAPGRTGVAELSVGGFRAGFAPPRGAPLDATLAALGAAMDYRIVAASAEGNEDDPLRIAEALGLDAALVAHARTLLAKK